MVAAQPAMANVPSPLEDGGSKSDIVVKILSGAFGP
jgi:hypothetical protein